MKVENIMNDFQQSITQLGFSLAEATTKVTASAINSKIKTIRANKNKDEQITEYRQIINELQENKSDLQNISNQYKEIVESINISDDDIKALHNTIKKVVGILINFSDDNDNLKEVEGLVELLDADTLKTLQLIGFNYKKAIGEPLTKITSEYINNKFQDSQHNLENN